MRLISQFSRASGARFSETDDSPETVVGGWILPAKLKALLGSSTILSQVIPGKYLMAESKSPLFGITPDRTHGAVAVGDAKYKKVLEGIPAEQLGDLEGAIIPRISPADWNQLYVYMRLTGAPRGFFLVPFWRAGTAPIIPVKGFNFTIDPLDRIDSGRIRVGVFGLNMLMPLHAVRPEALSTITNWLEETSAHVR